MSEQDDVSNGAGPRETTYLEAITAALREEMVRDPWIIILGADIGGAMGGNPGITDGLQQLFGRQRVLVTPPATHAIVGTAIGTALMGMRPVAAIHSIDELVSAYDQIVDMAAKLYWRSGGELHVPLVIRGPSGGGTHGGPWRSQSPESWLVQAPGLKVVVPATPYDAKGLLKAAIRDNNPVVFLEQRYLYYRLSEVLPTEDYIVPIGQAEIRREGSHLTILTYGAMVYNALDAADVLAMQHGIEAEVIDLRTLAPLDMTTIATSVQRTGRVLITHETSRTGGIGAEIAARIADQHFDRLRAPIIRVTAPDTPYPAAAALEAAYLPGPQQIIAAARSLLQGTGD